jgi:endogenous inhibitor of DNA gyrase (YacG/DUF329 family)
MKAPLVFGHRSGDRLTVECPTCQVTSELDYVGTRPLLCGHVADVRARTDPLRIIKARGWSVCPSCQRAVMPGQRIARGGSGWSHVRCVVETQPTEGATDGRRH